MQINDYIKAYEKGAADENCDPSIRAAYAATAETLRQHLRDLAHHAAVEREVMQLRAEVDELKQALVRKE